jgi:hypothetical protein
MRNIRFIFSLLLAIVGLFFISGFSFPKMTGYVVGGNLGFGNSFLGFIFLISGIVLFIAGKQWKLERNLAQEIKESGKRLDNPKEIIRIAEKSGYIIGKKECHEGTKVYNQFGKVVTVIPKHNISNGTYHNIIKELAEGKSNFRKNC